MRRLWITRKKAFAGCAVKIKFYIEDPENGTETIGGVRCRKLGELKNGEQKRFAIGDEAARVYAVGDKLTRNICNEYYQLEWGQDDVFLTGKVHLGNTNMFLFDGVTDKAALENRKKSSGIGRTIMIGAVVVGLLGGFFAGRFAVNEILHAPPEPLIFMDEGMHITLTDQYERLDVENFTLCYGTQNTTIFVLKEEFSLAEGFGDLTVEEYGELVLEANGLTGVVALQKEGELTFFEYNYENPETGDLNNYFSVVYKGPDAFWTCQFVCLEENAAQFRPEFLEFAESVVFLRK